MVMVTETTATIEERTQGNLDYFKRLGAPIVGVATAVGGPIAVLRISGKNLNFLSPLCGVLPKAGTFEYRKIKNSQGELLDRALVLFFAGPHSFTGEDVVELHCHGVESLIQTLVEECRKRGALSALPGEFSFRAVLNEKLSLEAAEGLHEALSIEGLGAAGAAKLLNLKSGSHSVTEKISGAVNAVVAARARVEAAIDFPEAEQEQSLEISSATERIAHAILELRGLLNAFEIFRKNEREPEVVLVGEVNAGKSTLFNLLAGGERALVSPHAGTTRDVLELRLKTPQGRNFRLLDTAGLRTFENIESSADQLEEQGIARALLSLKDAALLIHVKDSRKSSSQSLVEKSVATFKGPVISVGSHGDLAVPSDSGLRSFNFCNQHCGVQNFILTAIDEELSKSLASRAVEGGTVDAVVSQRQYGLLVLALEELNRAQETLKASGFLELVTENLREAESKIRQALGRGLSEHYLGAIFSEFCLGK